MILSALYEHYGTLVKRPGSKIARPGYSTARVSFAFNLSKSGELLDVIMLADRKGKKLVSVSMIVPEQKKRASGIAPNFLCDNCKYFLGVDIKGKPERSVQAFEASKKLHIEILQNVDDEGAQAVCQYFLQWNPALAKDHPKLSGILEDIMNADNIVFMLDSNPGYIHDRESIKAAWEKYRIQTSSDVIGQCLVTGEIRPIARLHPSIKGVRGAQTSGASLSSFNLEAFTSYGKTQNFNAPLSEEVAFGYATALNYMLSRPNQRLQLDTNTTVVFWSERPAGDLEETIIGQLFDLRADDESSSPNERVYDPETTKLVLDVLNHVRKGQQFDFEAFNVDPNSRFYILGLSPNVSRLSVRFFHVDSFGNMVNRIAKHHKDLAIIAPAYRRNEFISVREILRETAPRRDWDKVPPLLGGGLMRSILMGSAYPQSLYTAMIARIRADQEVNYVRAAVIKAILTRRIHVNFKSENSDQRNQGVNISMVLDEQNTNVGYRLGRLFAVLEKTQQDANPGLNATIRDRYFASASATPRAVFPQLLRLVQHHVSKAKYGSVSDRMIEEVVSCLNKFPSHLNLEDQGMFMLGYYHQRQAFYQKREQE